MEETKMTFNRIRTGIKTNDLGNAEAVFEIFGKIWDINLVYGEAEETTEVTFQFSHGRTIKLTGNKESTFPYSPRRSPNEGVQNLNAAYVLEPYVNAGAFGVKIENAGAQRVIPLVEVVWES
jgi:hypothetical protein